MPELRLPLEFGQPRALLPPARRLETEVDLSKQVQLTIVLRPQGSEDEWQELVAKLTSGPPAKRRYLTHAEFAKKWAASPKHIEAVRKFAAEQQLKIVSADPFRRCVVVSGTLRRVSKAFSVDFFAVENPLGTFRSHEGPPHVTESIHPLVECVLGLDAVPSATPYVADDPVKWAGMDRRALLEAYRIPPKLQGRGQCVATIELGGGYREADLLAYFGELRLLPPKVRTVSVDGVKNDPASAKTMHQYMAHEKLPKATVTQVSWTIETMTDLCMLGTIAPKASILLVQAPNTDQGQYHALAAVVGERKLKPSALSISWGAPEPRQTPSFMVALDRWFQAAAVLGITTCCSSGDSGCAPMTKDDKEILTAQFPASSPYVLGCGGTTLNMEARTEVAWNQTMNGVHMESGGGFSGAFPLPKWQKDAGIDPKKWIPKDKASGEGRAVPDVAGRANLQQGYCIIVGGVGIPCGGTSAAAPLWAAVVAILNQGLKTRLGSLNESLYDGSLGQGLRDIVDGDTGEFHACKGWDACTGWGSPMAEELLDALSDG